MESNIKILRHGFADNISDYHYSNFQLSNSIPLGAILNFILKKLILHFDYVTLHNWLYHQNKNFFWKLSMYLNRKCLHKGDGLNSFRTVFISKIFLVNPHCPLKGAMQFHASLYIFGSNNLALNVRYTKVYIPLKPIS